ncbi:MAG: hypothetical protein RIF32_09665 [Leptospirales bacterium]|jgi:hypothetical protein
MNEGDAHLSSSSERAAVEPEEIALKVHDYARACRHELEQLERLQSQAAAAYQGAREAVARLESLATLVHPLLAEKIRRVSAIVRRVGREPTQASNDRFQSIYSRLEEIQDSPLWALPAPRRSPWPSRGQEGPVLKPGEIYPDRIVLYALGDLRFMVRGTLKYNLHRADLSREYATRRGGPILSIFPNPDQDSQAFPAPAYGGNLMVFAAPSRGAADFLGLRYDRILGIEDFQAARHERGVESLSAAHPVVMGRLSRRGVDYYVIRL